MNAGAELRAVLDTVAPDVRRAAGELWRPDRLRARYSRYLVLMHAVVRASVPLMELALAHCGGDDPVRVRLGAYLPAHIEEELHHDDWLLEDLAVAGGDPVAALAAPPPVEVAALVGPQYYWISHFHPVCVLGYIAALESNAPSPELGTLLAAWTGLPDDAFHTVRHHADVDDGHSGAIFALLDRLDLTPPLRLAVRTSALHAAGALIDLFTAVSQEDSHDRA
ncbi:iron-containing redox enzyme family protein [Amycolatopsis sp. NPDC049253]|uniref:iron-containing redox enzyme family protein n=1 Tax=Amycolatopsis sp. NPDC049253 TaxID=3155274 RepID=UPI00342CA82D